MQFIATGQAVEMNRRTDHHIDAFFTDQLQNPVFIIHRTILIRTTSQPGQSCMQQIPYTPRAFTRQQDQHPVSSSRKCRHPHPEEIHRQLLILLREIQPLGVAGCTGSGQSDDPMDFLLRDTHEGGWIIA
ncbi:MAG TPA: hypothetical protein PKK59_05560 [Anaerolineaceae bacterium]|nr:hypothetical protein [Anaerolineaceae bacterium]